MRQASAERRVFTLVAVALGLLGTTLVVALWAFTHAPRASADARRYASDAYCQARHLGAAPRTSASACRVVELDFLRGDVRNTTIVRGLDQVPTKLYTLTLTNGKEIEYATVAGEPPATLWARILDSRKLPVQFYDGRITGFEIDGTFVATVENPRAAAWYNSFARVFFPVCLVWLAAVVVLVGLTARRRTN